MASIARMGEEVPVAPAPVPGLKQDWTERIEKSIESGANHILSLQAEPGFWQGELEADTTLESDYIYYLHVLGKADPDRIAKLANDVRKRQLPDGGWSIYPGGPSELIATCVDELFRDPRRKTAAFDWSKNVFSWKNFFLALDRGLKLYQKSPWKPFRRRALREAKSWMLDHIERTEGLAAIYPAMMNSIFALLALGHGPGDPLTWREIKEFSRFEIEEGDTIRMQPCVSPVWDTCVGQGR